MVSVSSQPEPPRPVVTSPVLRVHARLPPRPVREGKGFSEGEVRELGLTVAEARLLGIFVDKRRKSVHPENVERLRQYLLELKRALEQGAEPPRPALPEKVVVKADPTKVFKGKTAAGRRGRGLLSLKLRYTHHYKWKRKQRERLLKKRHEAARHKGGD
ncbi:MAG: ribosomal protein L13e [Thermofilum sp.]